LLAGLPSIFSKSVFGCFDGGRLSPNASVLSLREIKNRLGKAERLAACLQHLRAPEWIEQRFDEIIRQRVARMCGMA
jgi:hypothetical protein